MYYFLVNPDAKVNNNLPLCKFIFVEKCFFSIGYNIMAFSPA